MYIWPFKRKKVGIGLRCVLRDHVRDYADYAVACGCAFDHLPLTRDIRQKIKDRVGGAFNWEDIDTSRILTAGLIFRQIRNECIFKNRT